MAKINGIIEIIEGFNIEILEYDPDEISFDEGDEARREIVSIESNSLDIEHMSPSQLRSLGALIRGAADRVEAEYGPYGEKRKR